MNPLVLRVESLLVLVSRRQILIAANVTHRFSVTLHQLFETILTMRSTDDVTMQRLVVLAVFFLSFLVS